MNLIKAYIKKLDDILFRGKLQKFISAHYASKKIFNPYYFQMGQNYPYRGYEAMQKLLKDYDFHTVLDVGCGEGIQSKIMSESGKTVTGLDYGESVYFRKNSRDSELIITDINTWETDRKFDCIWCSHVLEHQLNVDVFLQKLYDLLNEGGGTGNYGSAAQANNCWWPCKLFYARITFV